MKPLRKISDSYAYFSGFREQIQLFLPMAFLLLILSDIFLSWWPQTFTLVEHLIFQVVFLGTTHQIFFLVLVVYLYFFSRAERPLMNQVLPSRTQLMIIFVPALTLILATWLALRYGYEFLGTVLFRVHSFVFLIFVSLHFFRQFAGMSRGYAKISGVKTETGWNTDFSGSFRATFLVSLFLNLSIPHFVRQYHPSQAHYLWILTFFELAAFGILLLRRFPSVWEKSPNQAIYELRVLIIPFIPLTRLGEMTILALHSIEYFFIFEKAVFRGGLTFGKQLGVGFFALLSSAFVAIATIKFFRTSHTVTLNLSGVFELAWVIPVVLSYSTFYLHHLLDGALFKDKWILNAVVFSKVK